MLVQTTIVVLEILYPEPPYKRDGCLMKETESIVKPTLEFTRIYRNTYRIHRKVLRSLLLEF
jgi:hypothetical protein